MSDYSSFPPLVNFKRVLQSCPTSALLYISMWKITGANRNLSVKKKEIKKKFLISPTLFRNHLLALGRADILSFEETIDYMTIDFMA